VAGLGDERTQGYMVTWESERGLSDMYRGYQMKCTHRYDDKDSKKGKGTQSNTSSARGEPSWVPIYLYFLRLVFRS
jgi:hypothetical protein